MLLITQLKSVVIKTMRIKLPTLLIILALTGGEATMFAAPPFPLSNQQSQQIQKSSIRALPRTVSLRETRERGFLARVWINNAGPFNFAVDTGAGVTLISSRIAAAASISRSGTAASVGGLSGESPSRGTNAVIRSLSIGDGGNMLSPNHKAILVDNLPEDLDGILDPTSAYSPYGYSIDLPNRSLAAFDPREHPLSTNQIPQGGTVVRWLRMGGRPFVRLGDGRIALLDTGSGFGLAISTGDRRDGRRTPVVHDLGSGQVSAERVSPATVTIGDLTLRKVPTDLLSGVESNAPILLGRDALYPFRLTFDPLRQLIEIAPVAR